MRSCRAPRGARFLAFALVLASACADAPRPLLKAAPRLRGGQRAATPLAGAHERRDQPVRRRQRLTVVTVGMALFVDVLLLLMVVPMLPSLLEASGAGGAGGRDVRLALLFSAKEFAQCLCAPFAGALTLRFGSRAALMASLLGLAASTVAFAEARSYPQLVCARLSQGATSAALMSGGLTLITETHPAERRSRALAQAHSGLGLGAALGPVLGGLGYERLGRRGTFYAVAALVGLTALAHASLHLACPAPAVALRAEARRRRSRSSAPLPAQLRRLLGSADVCCVLLGMLATYAAGGLYDATYAVHLSDTFGIGPARASTIFAIEPVAYLATLTLLARRPPSRSGSARLAASGLCLVGLSLPLLTAGGALPAVLASLVLHGAGYGAKDAVGHGLLADLVDEGRLGSYAMAFALADATDSLGYIVGPLAGAALSRAFAARGRAPGLVGFGALAILMVQPTAALGRRAAGGGRSRRLLRQLRWGGGDLAAT